MFDTKFEMALSEFMCAEGETLMIENEVIDHEFSDKFLRNMDKLINRRRKPYFRMINTVGKRAACIALAIFIASATTVMSVDALRNAVFNFFEKAFEKNSTVYVGSDENHPETIEEIYEITYDLSDYDIRDVDNCEWYRRKEYYHGDTTIVFYQYTQEMFDGININAEDAVIKETDINGYPATYFLDNQGYYSIMWDNGRYIFTILANLDKEQAFKIAKSIKKVETK